MESIVLLIFLLQQLGVTLGVGASTFAMMFYIVGISDGEIDASERRFMHATYTTIRIGLFLIIITGLATAAAHYLAGDIATLLQPAFIFKWILLFIIIMHGVLVDTRILSSQIGGVIAGASWYALFVIHALSPVTNWFTVIALYIIWLIVFSIGFYLTRAIAISKYKSEGTLPLQKKGTHIASASQTTNVHK